ncbi:MAG: hypothetical protein KKD07_06965 [Candidatus Omnitrophica bacterium]|nr:hypothetical protein [Candidatus Omnitrophota bacterium]MBU1997575.1 hypothetical protein [Candidatus Omnitrophota bacterium]MBU4334165.1 hypothetical protein [Candidatus Omnitrophota bacterium]
MIKLKKKEKDLTRRYLIWCYKTTKESLDRIERYYTQIPVDQYLLKQLMGSKDFKSSKTNKKYKNLVNDFEQYIDVKKKNVDAKKFEDLNCKKLDPEYQYLKERFAAIEKAIAHFLGKKELETINSLYEAEMTDRILNAREHL